MGNSGTFVTPQSTGNNATVLSTAEGQPVRQNIFNELDEMGLLLGQPRIAGERNATYKRRLLDTFANRASSTYRGLINGITRGLGLSLFDAITITPIESGGSFVATSPAVVFSEAFVYLYKDYSIGLDGLDRKLDRFDRTGTAAYLTDLVDRINESSYFTASIGSGIDPYTRSMTILNQKSHISVPTELVPPQKAFALKNTNIINGTLYFSDRVRLLTEVSSAGAVNSSGKYYIDYKNGIVTTFDTPLPNTTVRYDYIKSPMVCRASPVIIHNLQSVDFKVKMFEQVLKDDGTYCNGLATALGSDIINELLTAYPVYWGE